MASVNRICPTYVKAEADSVRSLPALPATAVGQILLTPAQLCLHTVMCTILRLMKCIFLLTVLRSWLLMGVESVLGRRDSWIAWLSGPHCGSDVEIGPFTVNRHKLVTRLSFGDDSILGYCKNRPRTATTSTRPVPLKSCHRQIEYFSRGSRGHRADRSRLVAHRVHNDPWSQALLWRQPRRGRNHWGRAAPGRWWWRGRRSCRWLRWNRL